MLREGAREGARVDPAVGETEISNLPVSFAVNWNTSKSAMPDIASRIVLYSIATWVDFPFTTTGALKGSGAALASGLLPASSTGRSPVFRV